MSDPAAQPDAAGGGFSQRMLDLVERAGNKVPHPAILFLALCGIVIVLSQVLYWADVSVTSEVAEPPAVEVQQRDDAQTSGPSYELPGDRVEGEDYEVETETFSVKGLLTGDGIRFMFTSLVSNFLGFTALGVILVAMIGVGIAEHSGLIGALIRKLVAISSPGSLTYIIVFVGILSSVAADAGYLVLIPLAATAFLSVGRNPLAGIAAGFAAVSAAFSVNILITPADGVITDITNEAAAARRLERRHRPRSEPLLRDRLHDPRDDRDRAHHHADHRASPRRVGPQPGRRARSSRARKVRRSTRRLRPRACAGRSSPSSACWRSCSLLTLPSGAPLRNPETGDIIGDSPLMSSLIVIISASFLAAGLAFGRATRHDQEQQRRARHDHQVVGEPRQPAVPLPPDRAVHRLLRLHEHGAGRGRVARRHPRGARPRHGWLLLGIVIVTLIIDFLIPAKIAKWAIVAPIFVPLMLRLGVEPQTVLAAYRVGDSPINVLTPLMPYFALMVVFARATSVMPASAP